MINLDNIIKKFECYIKFCNKLHIKNRKKEQEYRNKKINIFKLYGNGRLTDDEFNEKMEKLINTHYKSKIYNDLSKCVIKNCYDSVKISLDEKLLKLSHHKYKKPATYTNEDFINITHLYDIEFNINKIMGKPNNAIFMVNLIEKLKNK